MSQKTDTSKTDDSRTPDVADELARALGMTGPMPRPDDASPGARPDDGERLDLDKDGTLRSVEKLEPVRAHRQGDEDAPERVAETPVPAGRKPKRATLPPKLSLVPPDPAPDAVRAAEPETGSTPDRLAAEIEIPGGEFLFGEEQEAAEVPPFAIDKYPVTHRQYEAFVRATGHRSPLYWPEGRVPAELLDHPVVGVDYFDALAYARWNGKDLPFEDEWERAARGTDGRTFPWGNETDLNAANTARGGLKVTIPVGVNETNVSPDGVVDTMGNCWEITHSPAPGGGIIVRGGSWFDFALYAKTWFRFGTRSDTRNGTVGFRCVRRDDERDGVREVDPERVEAEILARSGAQPPVDASTFSPEKRDLVPDLRRLRSLHEDLGLAPVGEAPVAAAAPVRAAPKREAPPVERLVDPDAYARTPREPRKLGSRATAKRAEASEPAEAADVERRHVPDPDLAPPAPRAAVTSTEAPEAEPASEATLLRTRQGMWGLAALAFLLVAGLVGVLVERAAPKGAPSAGSASDVGDPLDEGEDALGPIGLDAVRVDPLAALPPAPDEIDAVVHPVAEIEGRLAEGVWMLLFIDPTPDVGTASTEAAREVVARVGASGVRTAVVVRSARDAPAGGVVIVDPEGRLRAAHAVRTDLAAVVLRDGTLEILTQPPADLGFTRLGLAPIALEAAALVR